MVSPPARLAAAASNVVGKVLHGGVADLRPMPRVLIDQGPNRSVYRMTHSSRPVSGPPILLVPPLAAPAICFDLRRGCSLIEHLVEARPQRLPRRLRHGRVLRPPPGHRALDRRGAAAGDPAA